MPSQMYHQNTYRQKSKTGTTSRHKGIVPATERTLSHGSHYARSFDFDTRACHSDCLVRVANFCLNRTDFFGRFFFTHLRYEILK